MIQALLVALVLVPVAPTYAANNAISTPPLSQLEQQLNDAQAKLTTLNDQVERAQSTVDDLNHRLADDRQREAALGLRLAGIARMQYEQPAMTLSTILEARSLNQLLSNMAQARLVAHKQQSLLQQTRDLRKQDEVAHDQMAGQLATVTTARDAAATLAAQALTLRNAAQDAAQKARAQSLNLQAQATQSPPSPSGAWPNHFTFGYCTYYVAMKRYVPWFGDAIQWWPNAAAYGYAEGQTPRVGAIMVTRESAPGHVAYVEAVNSDGSWRVSEMNFVAWNVVSSRTLRPGQAPVVGFIY
jgi:surface antigen